MYDKCQNYSKASSTPCNNPLNYVTKLQQPTPLTATPQMHHFYPQQQQQLQPSSLLLQQQQQQTPHHQQHHHKFNPLQSLYSNYFAFASPDLLNDNNNNLLLNNTTNSLANSIINNNSSSNTTNNNNNESKKLYKFYHTIPFKCPYCFSFRDLSSEFIDHLATKHYFEVKSRYDLLNKTNSTNETSFKQQINNKDNKLNNHDDGTELGEIPSKVKCLYDINGNITNHNNNITTNEFNDSSIASKRLCYSDSNSIETASHHSEENASIDNYEDNNNNNNNNNNQQNNNNNSNVNNNDDDNQTTTTTTSTYNQSSSNHNCHHRRHQRLSKLSTKIDNLKSKCLNYLQQNSNKELNELTRPSSNETTNIKFPGGSSSSANTTQFHNSQSSNCLITPVSTSSSSMDITNQTNYKLSTSDFNSSNSNIPYFMNASSSMHCAICNRGFEYYSNLRRHIKTKHKIFGKEVKEYVVRHNSPTNLHQHQHQHQQQQNQQLQNIMNFSTNKLSQSQSSPLIKSNSTNNLTNIINNSNNNTNNNTNNNNSNNSTTIITNTNSPNRDNTNNKIDDEINTNNNNNNDTNIANDDDDDIDDNDDNNKDNSDVKDDDIVNKNLSEYSKLYKSINKSKLLQQQSQSRIYSCPDCTYETESQSLIDKHIKGHLLKTTNNDINNNSNNNNNNNNEGSTKGGVIETIPTCSSPASSISSSSSYSSSPSPTPSTYSPLQHIQYNSQLTQQALLSLTNMSNCMSAKFKTSLLEALLTRKIPNNATSLPLLNGNLETTETVSNRSKNDNDQMDQNLANNTEPANFDLNTVTANQMGHLKKLLKNLSKANGGLGFQSLTPDQQDFYNSIINKQNVEGALNLSNNKINTTNEQQNSLNSPTNNSKYVNNEHYDEEYNSNHDVCEEYEGENSNCSSINNANNNNNNISSNNNNNNKNQLNLHSNLSAQDDYRKSQTNISNSINFNNSSNSSSNSYNKNIDGSQVRYSTEVWRCPYCCYETTSASRYNSHLVCHGWKPYLCPHCGSRSNRLPDMRTHISTFHPEHNVNTFVILNEDEAKSTLKDYMKNRALINRKLKEMRPQPKFKCKLCPYASLYQFNLTKHVKSVHLTETYNEPKNGIL